MYARKIFRRNGKVENMVERVEFHPQNRLDDLTFKLFSQGFQHVEKSGGVYRLYINKIVENFDLWQNRRIREARRGNNKNASGTQRELR